MGYGQMKNTSKYKKDTTIAYSHNPHLHFELWICVPNGQEKGGEKILLLLVEHLGGGTQLLYMWAWELNGTPKMWVLRTEFLYNILGLGTEC